MRDLLQHTAALAHRDFQLPQPEQYITEADLFNFLAAHIADLIEHHLERLMAILYRLDVSEAKVYDALRPENPQPAHVAIAQLVLERERQKAKTRLEYGSDEPGDGSW